MNRKKIFLAILPQWNVQQPPLGISYLAPYIKKYGYQVTQRDLSIEFYTTLSKDKKYLLESSFHLNWINENDYMEKVYPEINTTLAEWAKELSRSDFSIIGFTMLSTNWIPTLQIAEAIKRNNPEKIIVIGGPHATRYGAGEDIANKEYIDFVVPGEGEETFKELLDALNGENDISKVPGLLFRKGDKLIDTGIRDLIKNIDYLPHPSFKEYPLRQYDSLVVPILGSRGCINKCSFCSERTFWGYYRFRTGENIFKEIEHHYQEIGPHYFYIVDSLINGNIHELEKFCDYVVKSGINIYWGGKASLRKEMTEKLLCKMRKAGCLNLDYGMESASSKVLKDMNKTHTPMVASEILKNTYNAGIKVGLFWIIGFPTESNADFQESVNFLRDHTKYIDHVTPGYGCGIQQGSDLYNNCKKYGVYWKEGEWFSEFTNPEIRADRIRIFREYCDYLRIPAH